MKKLLSILLVFILVMLMAVSLSACAADKVFENELFQQAMAVIIPIVAAALGTALTAGATAFAKYISEKTRSARLSKYIEVLEETVYDVVQKLNQTEVLALKEAAADGKLTKDEITRISQSALDTVLAILGVTGVKVLGMVYTDVNEVIANKIERVVLEVKTAPSAVAA